VFEYGTRKVTIALLEWKLGYLILQAACQKIVPKETGIVRVALSLVSFSHVST